MPCDSIIENSVELGKMHPTLLRLALEALGVKTNGKDLPRYFTLDGERCRISGQRLIVEEGNEGLADRIKRAYSAEVIKYTAKRNNWTLRKTAEFEYEVIK